MGLASVLLAEKRFFAHGERVKLGEVIAASQRLTRGEAVLSGRERPVAGSAARMLPRDRTCGEKTETLQKKLSELGDERSPKG